MEILGGPLFAVAGAGESHGPGVTTMVFGCPPGLNISRLAVQVYLDRRRPGSNKHGTPRNEKDKVVFLSGLYDPDHDTLTSGPEIQIAVDKQTIQTESYQIGYTTGEPIAALVLSTSKKSRHYEQFIGSQGEVRPGHTDLVKYHKSQGFVDIRGGGRSSYRSTISDVIGGSIARLYLQEKFETYFLSSICQVGSLKANQTLAERSETLWQQYRGETIPVQAIKELETHLQQGEIHTIDHDFARQAGELIKATRKTGDSIGAIVEVVALNVPPLLGDPLYNSLKLRLMGSLGGLHAVQACEMGSGIDVASRLGSQNNDPIRQQGYISNHHGGLIGGMSTGKAVVFRVSFKPTSTIIKPQQSVRKDLTEIDFMLKKGRHDPCVGVRAGVTLESRMAIEILNAMLSHQARSINQDNFKLF